MMEMQEAQRSGTVHAQSTVADRGAGIAQGVNKRLLVLGVFLVLFWFFFFVFVCLFGGLGLFFVLN